MKPSNISSVIKKFLRQHQRGGSIRLIHPHREWGIGVLIGVILIIVSLTWSVLVYVEYRYDASVSVTGETENITAYRAALVQQALTYTDERAATLAEVIETQRAQLTPATEPPTVATSTAETSAATTTEALDASGGETEDTAATTTSEEIVGEPETIPTPNTPAPPTDAELLPTATLVE